MWRIDLDTPQVDVQEMRDELPVDELRRVDSLRDGLLQRRFLAAHWALRRILAAYLDCRPVDLVIEAGVHGKPFLAGHDATALVHFNLAHSANLQLCAIAQVEVGIDLEQLRPLAQIGGAAPGVLSSQEMSLANLPAVQDRQAALHVLWTCKEAYVKAAGTGLRLDLTETTVITDLPSDPSRWFQLDSPHGQVSARMLTPQDGFFAALVVMGAPQRLRFGQFSAEAFGHLSLDG